MVLEKLGEALRSALKRIAGASHIDASAVRELIKDIQRALLQADVNVELTLAMTKRLEERALTEKPPAGMSAREHVVRIVYEEIAGILGKGRAVQPKKQRILLLGLYGQGKTTTAGKLARDFHKKGLSVGMIAADVHRPAAYDQLKQIGDKLNIPVYGDPKEKRAERLVKKGLAHFEGTDVVIVDTSGRHSLEPPLIEELRIVAELAQADEKLLVLDAVTGQQAGPQASAFHQAVGLTGVILTKMDGTAKGGGALSAVAATGAPIAFLGVGEHLEDLEGFEPTRFVSRMLGMGDIQTLLERAQESLDQQKAEEAAKKLLSGRFTLKEMYDQMEMLQGMGPLKKLLGMIPGVSDRMSGEDMEQTQARLARYRVIMDSMTEEEMENPSLLKASRVQRVARGSGHSQREVRELLRQYENARKAMKGLLGNRKMRRQLLKQFRAGGLQGLPEE